MVWVKVFILVVVVKFFGMFFIIFGLINVIIGILCMLI